MEINWDDAPQPPEFPEPPGRVCRVELTPEQRREVAEATGRELHFVDIADPHGDYTMSMHKRTPPEVTELAITQAEILNEYDEAHKAYLVALAKWQDEIAEQQAEALAEAEEKAQETADEIIERVKEMAEQEERAFEAAREVAIEHWDPDGKKRKAAAKRKQ